MKQTIPHATDKLRRHIRLVIVLVTRDLRLKYIGSVLGSLWRVIDPLSRIGLYLFVFSVVLRLRFADDESTLGFALNLMCGLFPWMAFHEALQRSTNAVTEHAHFVKKAGFPPAALPVYLTLSPFVTQLIGLALLMIVIVATGRAIAPALLMLPALFLIQLVFSVGLAWLLAALNVFLKDIGHGVQLVLLVWMFVTPIFYPPTLLAEKCPWLLRVNPMSHLVTGYRAALLGTSDADATGLLILAGAAALSFVIGLAFFVRSQHQFVDLV